jgi:hypothetical protein
MAMDPNESNYIEEIIFKCQWGHWPFLLVGENVTTLALASWPRQGLPKVQAKSEVTRVTFHAPKSVGKCEGMNPHTPKWAPTWGVGVPMDFRVFKGIS